MLNPNLTIPSIVRPSSSPGPEVKSLRDVARHLHSRFLPYLDVFQPSPRTFNILHQNVCSLLPKIDHFASLPHLQEYHIISISETWLKPDLPDSHLSLANFTIHRSDRKSGRKSRGGGAALFIKHGIKSTPLDLGTHMPSCDSVWILVQIEGRRDVVIATAYLPPDSNKAQFIQELDHVLDDPVFNRADLVLVGDLNINWNSNSPHRRGLGQLMEDNNMYQTVRNATHVSSTTGSESLIDVCLLSRALPVTKSTTLLSDLSDHYAITTSLDILCRRVKPRALLQVRNYSGCLSSLSLIPRDQKLLEDIGACECPSRQAIILEDWVTKIVDQHAPVRQCRIRPDSPRWLTGELKRLVAAKNRFYRRAYSIGSDTAILQYKKFRNKIQSELKKARRAHFAEKLSMDSRSFFAHANSFLGRGHQTSQGGPVEIRTSDNEIISSPMDMADELNRFFTSIPSPDPSVSSLTKDLTIPEFKFRPVKPDEIAKLLRRLSPSKRGGTAQTPASVYKCLEATIVPAMTILVNRSIAKSTFPKIYKSALVSCIHKSGDRRDPGNYRPISSLPILSKILEHVLNRQITDHVNEHSLLSDKQFGFRNGLNTEQMLLSVLDGYLSSLDTKSPVYIAQLSLDVKKAFDTVNHDLLCRKLSSEFSFHTSSCSLLASYLSGREQRTKLGSHMSVACPISKGVPQGSILGPLLFNMMVNNMLCEHNSAHAYADDTLIYSVASTQSVAITKVSATFDRINRWYTSNGLSLSVHKTNCLIISNRKVDYNQKIVLANSVLPIRSSIKVLGVILDSKLNFKDHISMLKGKVSSQLYALRRARQYLDNDQTKQIYTSIIRPRLEYCSSLFFKTTLANSSALESCQNKAIRIICRAPRIFSVTDGRRCLDIHTLASRRSVAFYHLSMRAAFGISCFILFGLLKESGSSNTNLRSNCLYILPHTYTAYGLSRFTYQAIKAYKTPEDRRPELSFVQQR